MEIVCSVAPLRKLLLFRLGRNLPTLCARSAAPVRVVVDLALLLSTTLLDRLRGLLLDTITIHLSFSGLHLLNGLKLSSEEDSSGVMLRGIRLALGLNVTSLTSHSSFHGT